MNKIFVTGNMVRHNYLEESTIKGQVKQQSSYIWGQLDLATQKKPMVGPASQGDQILPPLPLGLAKLLPPLFFWKNQFLSLTELRVG